MQPMGIVNPSIPVHHRASDPINGSSYPLRLANGQLKNNSSYNNNISKNQVSVTRT